MDLMKLRRIMLAGKRVVNIPFNTIGTSNSSTSWDKSNYAGGTLTITVKSTSSSYEVLNYRNGYMTFYAPDLVPNAYYILTADVVVTRDVFLSDLISVAPYGSNTNRTDGEIVNGKINLKFQFKQGTGDKRIEFRVGGKSMVLSNIKIWTA